MEISLREINRYNWKTCIALKIHDHQKGLVATNLYSLAQAKAIPSYVPLAAYLGETMVGFVMYGTIDKEYWILRVMIDKEYQGRGLGRLVAKELLKHLRGIPDCRRVYISYDAHNKVAEHLYTSLGFEPTGDQIRTEVIACLNL